MPESMPVATLADVVAALRELYTEDGIALWLGAPNRMLDGERAIEVCTTQAGRERVLNLVVALAEGAFV